MKSQRAITVTASQLSNTDLSNQISNGRSGKPRLGSQLERIKRQMAGGASSAAWIAATFLLAQAAWSSSLTWQEVDLGASDDLSLPMWGNGHFVVFEGNDALVSSDGVNWSRQSSTAPNGGHVAYGADLFVGVGGRSTFSHGSWGWIETSVDGVSWVDRTPSEFENVALYDIAWGSEGFVLSGDGDVATSPDGVNWTWQNVFVGSGPVVYGDGHYVILPPIKNGTHSSVSSNGTDWASGTATRGTSGIIHGAAYGSGVYTAVGMMPSADGSSGVVLRSADGLAWQEHSIGEPSLTELRSIAYGGGFFVAVGRTSPGKGLILVSANGQIWETGSETTGELRGVTFGNGRFVVSGDSGLLLASSAVADQLTVGILDQNSQVPVSSATRAYVTRATSGVFNESQRTDDNGETAWHPPEAGETHQFRALYYGPNAFESTATAELWAQGDVTGDGSVDSLTLTRNMPFSTSFDIRRPSDGAPIPESAILATVTSNRLMVAVNVTNGTDIAQQIRVSVKLGSSDVRSPEDGAYDHTFTGTVAGRSSLIFTNSLSAAEIAASGTVELFHRAVMVETWVNGAWMKTDAWDWLPAFKVIDLSEVAASEPFTFSGFAWTSRNANAFSGLWDENVSSNDVGGLVLSVTPGGVGAHVQALQSECKYGVYTVRMRIPVAISGEGGAHAFFSCLDSDDKRIAVDFLADDPGYASFMVKGWGLAHLARIALPAPADGYHEYTLDWRDDRAIFLIDGVYANSVLRLSDTEKLNALGDLSLSLYCDPANDGVGVPLTQGYSLAVASVNAIRYQDVDGMAQANHAIDELPVCQLSIDLADAVQNGSGFTFSPGIVLTAWHNFDGEVTEDADPGGTPLSRVLQTTIYWNDESLEPYPAGISRWVGSGDGNYDAREKDYSIIAISEPDVAAQWGACPPADADPVVADTVYAVGYPGGGEMMFLAAKVIAASSPESSYYFDIAGSVLHGHSGGPVFDREGKVVGIVASAEPDKPVSHILKLSAISTEIEPYKARTLSSGTAVLSYSDAAPSSDTLSMTEVPLSTLPESTDDGAVIVSAVDIGPDGTSFDPGAVLRIDYDASLAGVGVAGKIYKRIGDSWTPLVTFYHDAGTDEDPSDDYWTAAITNLCQFVLTRPAPRDVPPQKAVNLWTSDGSVATNRTPTLTWSDPLGNATWFRIYLQGPTGGVEDSWVQQAWYPVGTELPAGTYSWWVYSMNLFGNGGWAGPSSFTIEHQLPGAVAPSSPVGLQTAVDRRPQFSWQAAANASWYHLWVNRVGGGKYTEKWVQAPATTWVLDVDFRGGDYEWWIAGWNADGYGDWSTGMLFSIPNSQPGVMELVSPTGGVSVATGTVTYQWNADPRASWHELWCAQNGTTFADNWYRATGIVSGPTASTTISGHGWGAYDWYVRGWGPDGMGDWSTAGEFVCGKATPALASTTLLTWDDTQTASAGWYNVLVTDTASGETQRTWWCKRADTTDAGGGDRSMAVSPALPAGDYEWSIRAWSGVYGMGPWSAKMAFSVADLTPGRAVAVSPMGVLDDSESRPLFSWTTPRQANRCRLSVQRNGTNYQDLWVFGLSHTFPFDLPSGNYEWWVQAENEWGPGRWSESAQFAVPGIGVWMYMGDNRWYLPLDRTDRWDFDFSIRLRVPATGRAGIALCVQEDVPRYRASFFSTTNTQEVLQGYYGGTSRSGGHLEAGRWLTINVWRRAPSGRSEMFEQLEIRIDEPCPRTAEESWSTYYIGDDNYLYNGHGGFGVIVEGVSSCEYEWVR